MGVVLAVVYIALLLTVDSVTAGGGCVPHRRLLAKSRTLAQTPVVGKAFCQHRIFYCVCMCVCSVINTSP